MILNLNDSKHKELLQKLKGEYNKRQVKALKQFNYYNGQTDAYKDYPKTDRSNRKVNVNFIKSFIDEETSFMVGTPITYAAEEAIVKDIEYSLSNCNSTLDIELVRNYLIFGYVYELKYIQDGEFKIKHFTPLESIAYINEEGKAELFIRFYKKMLDDTVYMDIIDDKCIYKCAQDNYAPYETIAHVFGKCPVGVATLDNTLYDDIKTLQDAYENVTNDWCNEVGDTRLAYLLLTGCTLDEEDCAKMKSMGILQLPTGGQGSYLTKNLSSDFVKTLRDVLKEDIYRVASHIDNQTQIQSNTSGTMLVTRMNCLRLKIMSQNNGIKDCIKDRLRCLFIYLDLMEGKIYNYKEVKIEPQLNIPSNDVETAQIMTQLNNKLSVRTGLSKLSFVTNADEEFNKMLEEQKLISKATEPEVNLDMVGEEDEVNQEPTTI